MCCERYLVSTEKSIDLLHYCRQQKRNLHLIGVNHTTTSDILLKWTEQTVDIKLTSGVWKLVNTPNYKGKFFDKLTYWPLLNANIKKRQRYWCRYSCLGIDKGYRVPKLHRSHVFPWFPLEIAVLECVRRILHRIANDGTGLIPPKNYAQSQRRWFPRPNRLRVPRWTQNPVRHLVGFCIRNSHLAGIWQPPNIHNGGKPYAIFKKLDSQQKGWKVDLNPTSIDKVLVASISTLLCLHSCSITHPSTSHLAASVRNLRLI